MELILYRLHGYGWDFSFTMKPALTVLLWCITCLMVVLVDIIMSRNLKCAYKKAKKRRENEKRLLSNYPYFNKGFLFRQFYLGLRGIISKPFVISIFVTKTLLFVIGVLVVIHVAIISYHISVIIRVLCYASYIFVMLQLVYACTPKSL